ncbi:hypothetical protein GRZ55_11510 [Chelativorans sp. ZYF759]|uniref:hypothetical protein n=1 Tax=Chelativorans sp. ZYF759 TaxID=2692213 RepID=UPI00145EB830|nr:hypothetical protein [Chelativorans sp. ZYF759]NMG39870.1 hypothetical protein [Chelativorans sp. ZYF759]
MLGIPIEHLIPVANFIGLAVLGLLAWMGQRWGQRQTAREGSTMEIAGALVDSSSIRELTAAVSAHTAECAALRQENERARKLGYEIIETLGGLTRELSEIRSEMRMKRR